MYRNTKYVMFDKERSKIINNINNKNNKFFQINFFSLEIYQLTFFSP